MGSEYMAGSVASFKRNVPVNAVSRLAGINGKSNRQQMPPEGGSVLNPPRMSPRFNDRYRHDMSNVVNIPAPIPDASGEWFAPKEDHEPVEEERESVSGYSRGSGRSNRSGFSGTSWSSRPKSRTSPATEL